MWTIFWRCFLFQLTTQPSTFLTVGYFSLFFSLTTSFLNFCKFRSTFLFHPLLSSSKKNHFLNLVAKGLPWLPKWKRICLQGRRLFQSLGWEDSLEKVMATHPSILVWRIPWTEEPGGLQFTESRRVRHDWVCRYLMSFKGVCVWHVHTQSCPTLSMEISGKNTGAGLPFLTPGDLPDPGIKPSLFCLMHWQVGSLPLTPPGVIQWLGSVSLWAFLSWIQLEKENFPWESNKNSFCLRANSVSSLDHTVRRFLREMCQVDKNFHWCCSGY